MHNFNLDKLAAAYKIRFIAVNEYLKNRTDQGLPNPPTKDPDFSYIYNMAQERSLLAKASQYHYTKNDSLLSSEEAERVRTIISFH